MSQTLTEDAPSQDLAAGPATPDPAPSSGGEAPVGSAGGGDFIEKARFDGLMSSFNKTKNELEGRLAAASQEIDSLRAAQEENGTQVTEPNSDLAELQEQVGQLSGLLLKQQTDVARTEALNKYPEAKPLADLIVGNTPEEIEEVARTIADRLKGLQSEEVVTPEGDPAVETPVVDDEGKPVDPAPAAPEVPVVGSGTVTAPDSDAITTRKAEALQSGNLADFLDAAWEEQESAVSAQVS